MSPLRMKEYCPEPSEFIVTCSTPKCPIEDGLETFFQPDNGTVFDAGAIAGVEKAIHRASQHLEAHRARFEDPIVTVFSFIHGHHTQPSPPNSLSKNAAVEKALA